MKNKKGIILGIAGILILTSSVYVFAAENYAPSPSIEQNVGATPSPETPVVESDSVSTSPIDEVLTAVAVKDKMLNAIDHYSSLQGSYKTNFKAINEDSTVEFFVQEGNGAGSYTKLLDNNTGIITEYKAAESKFLQLFHEEKKYKATLTEAVTPEKIEGPRVRKAEDGSNIYVYRQDPAFAHANDISFPQKYAFWLNDETQNYKLAGTDEILGRTAAIIEGKFDSFLSSKRKAETFKLWVDTQTGVLLKLVETNSSDEIVNSLEVTSLEFNGKINANVLSASAVPDGWTSIDSPQLP